VNRLLRVLTEPERLLAVSRYQARKLRRSLAPAWSQRRDQAHWQDTCADLLHEPPSRTALLMGVPRSGTTVLTALLAQVESLTVLSEPLLMHMHQGFFRWKDASGRARVCVRPVGGFLKAFSRQPGETTAVVLKETWRSDQHDIYPNAGLLHGLRQAGMPVLAIVRDPRAVWYSNGSRYGAMNLSQPPSQLHINEWNAFGQMVLAESIPYLRYEDVVTRPSEACHFAIRTLKLRPTEFRNELGATSGLGDERALAGGAVNTASLQKYLQLEEPVRKAIMDGCGHVATKFGYTPDAVPASGIAP
jgi:hypothetical protein